MTVSALGRRLLSSIAMLGVTSAPVLAQDFDYSSYAALFGEPVTEGVTGAPMRESQSPFATTIISKDDIRASPSHDIAGLLTTVAGLNTVRRSTGQVDVGVRGFNEPKPRGLLVLVNGRQVYLDSFGATDWQAIPIDKEEIKQIEVIRGPNGATYGFNAAEGVINIITDNPLFDKGSFAVAEYGTQASTRYAGGLTVPLGEAGGFRLTGAREESDEFTKRLPPTNPANATDVRRNAINGDLALRLSDKTNARLEASHSESRHSEVGPLYGVEDNVLTTHAVKGALEYQLESGHIAGTAYVNLLKDGVVRNQVWVAQAEYLQKIGARHTVRASAEYRKNYTRQRGAPIEFGINYNVMSAAFMWDWAMLDALSITNAVRVDHLDLSATKPPPVGTPYTQAQYDRSLTELSFNSAAVWQVSDLDQVRIEAARGVKIPSLVDFGMAAAIPAPPLGYLFIGGDPANDVTAVWNYEAEWRHTLPSLDASVRALLFYIERRDIIGAPGGLPDAVTPTGFSFLFKNRGDSDSRGITIEAEGRLGEAWRWSANYTNVDVNDRLTTPAAVKNLFPTDYEDAQPTHTANATLTFKDGRWLASAQAHYQSESNEVTLTATGFRPQNIDPFVDFGAKLEFQVTKHVALSVSGTNLLDNAQRQSSIGEVERRVFVTLAARL